MVRRLVATASKRLVAAAETTKTQRRRWVTSFRSRHSVDATISILSFADVVHFERLRCLGREA